jgi:hypothetical protein
MDFAVSPYERGRSSQLSGLDGVTEGMFYRVLRSHL